MTPRSLEKTFLDNRKHTYQRWRKDLQPKFFKVNSLKKSFGPEPIVRMITPLKLNEARSHIKAVSVIGSTV